MYGDTLHARIRRFDQLGVLIEQEEYECEIDPARSKMKLLMLYQEKAEISRWFDEFYADPMTQAIGL